MYLLFAISLKRPNIFYAWLSHETEETTGAPAAAAGTIPEAVLKRILNRRKRQLSGQDQQQGGSDGKAEDSSNSAEEGDSASSEGKASTKH